MGTIKPGASGSFVLVAAGVLSVVLVGCGGGGGGVAATPNNLPRLAYVANSGDNTMSNYEVATSSGVLRARGYVAADTLPASVTVDPSGEFANVTHENSGDISAFTVNATTGALTAVAGSPFTIGLERDFSRHHRDMAMARGSGI